MSDRAQRIEEILTRTLNPEMIDVRDESHLHIGHAGASDGKGHFAVTIVADVFDGLNRIQRHRLVFDALADMMQTDIHALSVKTFTPGEI